MPGHKMCRTLGIRLLRKGAMVISVAMLVKLYIVYQQSTTSESYSSHLPLSKFNVSIYNSRKTFLK